MKLFIPELGTVLRLTADWTFDLHYESRNKHLFKSVGFTGEGWSSDWAENGGSRSEQPAPRSVTIPKHTLLTVDRIYIRQGGPEFSSVTFRIGTSKDFTGKPRFWAKLEDVNQISCEVPDASQPWWTGLKSKLSHGGAVTVTPDSKALLKLLKVPVKVEPLKLDQFHGLWVGEWLLVAEGSKCAFVQVNEVFDGNPKYADVTRNGAKKAKYGGPTIEAKDVIGRVVVDG